MQRKGSWKKLISSSILSIHALFLVLLIAQPSFHNSVKDKKPLIVKTIAPKEPKMQMAKREKVQTPAPTKKEKLPSTPVDTKPKTTPPLAIKQAPKKQEPAPNTKKEPAIADKTLSTKKTAPPKVSQERSKLSDSLLKELEESLEKIDKPTSTPSLRSKLPKLSLQIDNPSSELSSEGEPLYIERLVSHLQNHLTLPDFGEVKIQLDLREDGAVDKIVVLSSKSRANKLYLEEHLPDLRFPPPEKVEGNGKCRFVFTFVNEV